LDVYPVKDMIAQQIYMPFNKALYPLSTFCHQRPWSWVCFYFMLYCVYCV